MKNVTIVAAALTAGLLAAGCGADRKAAQDAAEPVTQPTAAQTTGQTGAVPKVLRFTGTTLNGQTFDGASLAGRPVVLWSWTPGCAVCRGEAPNMAKVARQYGDRVAFVGVAGMADRQAMTQFAKTTGIDAFTQLADTDGSLWPKLGFKQQASFAFLRPDGSAEHAMGPQGAAQLSRRVAALTS